MTTRPRTALIVGAGIGGLAAALALRRAGWRVEVFEQADHPRELGFALLLAPNAMSALRRLGLADAVAAGGGVARLGEMRRPDGTVLRRFDAGRISAALGEPVVCILRPVLHGLLLESVGADTVHLSCRVTGVAERGGRATVTLADGRTADGDLLVGADGAGSCIRQVLHPGERGPRSSGLLAVRGVSFDTAHHLGSLSGAQYFGRGIEAGLGRASDRAVYWYLSIPARIAPPHAGGAGVLAAAVAAGFHAPFREIVAATRPEDLRLDELFERDPLARWGTGAITLLGDAAHPMLPHAGQGAAQALEDAAALGRLLAAAESVPGALRHYERVRARRTGAVVALARRNARVASIASALGCRLRELAMRLVPEAVVVRALAAAARPPRE